MFQRIYFQVLVLASLPFYAQDGTKRTIAFYNVENLFDTENDSLVYDDARTPEGYYRWTQFRYEKKVAALAEVIAQIGAQERGASPDLIGLCEIENSGVLYDLLNQPKIKSANYQFIHLDSPDERGIDVAFMYKPVSFQPLSYTTHKLELQSEELHRDRTRDQLVVTGWLEDTLVGCLVNHWPSRRGGRSRSAPHRIRAAQLNRKIVDSLRLEHPEICIINMGDFNDNPTDFSMQYILSPAYSDQEDLFNPMGSMYRKGFGSLAYRDQWSLFDQILLDSKFISEEYSGLALYRIGIYNPPELKTPGGRYKGYPFSTYSGGKYQGGVSDHFPVYVILKSKSD